MTEAPSLRDVVEAVVAIPSGAHPGLQAIILAAEKALAAADAEDAKVRELLAVCREAMWEPDTPGWRERMFKALDAFPADEGGG